MQCWVGGILLLIHATEVNLHSHCQSFLSLKCDLNFFTPSSGFACSVMYKKITTTKDKEKKKIINLLHLSHEGEHFLYWCLWLQSKKK